SKPWEVVGLSSRESECRDIRDIDRTKGQKIVETASRLRPFPLILST
nr:hypothetical protein [Tanacetum cinerariifolium]